VESLIQKPVTEIREFLAAFSAELRDTQIPNTYLIKFSQETKVGHPEINHLRGLIFNVATNQVYSLTYPVPLEFKDLPSDEQELLIKDLSTGEYHVQEALDGTLLRLSYIDEQFGWLLSTNGKADAREAFWMNGCSFAEQFWSAQPKVNFEELDKNYVYMFLLCHPLNVIVVNHKDAHVYHVTTYDRRTLKEVECDLGIEHPRSFQLTINDVVAQIRDAKDKPVASAGYMVVMKPDANGIVTRYRFENHNYTKARELRGDSNNTSFLLLSLMLDKDQTKLAEFLQYYPIYCKNVEILHKRLMGLVSKFYREYGIRFKEHADIFVHPRHHRFLSELHTHVYLGRLKGMNKTVQYQDIMDFVKAQPVAKVLYLLNYIYDL